MAKKKPPAGDVSMSIIRQDRVRTQIEHLRSIPELMNIRAQAEGVRLWARRAGRSLEDQNIAAEITLLCECRAGALLAAMEKAKGAREPGTERGKATRLPEGTASLSDLGVTKKTSHKWQLEAAVPEKDRDEYFAKAKKTGIHITQADLLKIAKTLKRTERLKRRKVPLSGNLYELHVGSVVDVCAALKASSVHAIVTDPPYGEDALEDYARLAVAASRVLVEGGHLIVMTGQAHLPEIFQQLGRGKVRYHWTIAYMTPGPSTVIWGRNVLCNWKPVLWFVKGKGQSEQVGDVVTNAKPDRRFHKWGQAVDGMAQLIERFTVEGETVLDPFLGAGSTGLAAVSLKRRFIGGDIDPSCVQQSAERLGEIKV